MSVEPGPADLGRSLPPSIGGADLAPPASGVSASSAGNASGAVVQNGSAPLASERPGSSVEPRGVEAMTDASASAETADLAVSQGRPIGGCTQAQLRRFIKSRPYVPVHEIRRRFALNGADDDVHALELEESRLFVGLPPREARMLGELVRQGDVGYELLLDPVCPVVVGVFPMRPVPRS